MKKAPASAAIDLSAAVRLTIAREIALRFPPGAEREAWLAWLNEDRSDLPLIGSGSSTQDAPIDGGPGRARIE